MKKQHKPTEYSPELSRLMSAAVISPSFRRLLLQDPAAALKGGYMGRPFDLSPEEHVLVCSIQATTLEDFADQLFLSVAEDRTDLSPPVDAGGSCSQLDDRLAHPFVRQETTPDQFVEEAVFQQTHLPWDTPLELVAEPA